MVTRVHREQPALHGAHTRTTESSTQMAGYDYTLGTVAELITNFNPPFPETHTFPLLPHFLQQEHNLGTWSASWSRFSRESLPDLQ